MSKKLLIIGNNSGGLYGFRGMLLSRLVEEGNKVVVLTPFDDNIEELESIGVRLINTPIERRGLNPFKDFQLMKLYYKFIQRFRPDLVITYTIKPNIYGGLLCRIKRIPYAINITGLGTAFQKKGILRKLIVVLYKVSGKKAKVVFFENIENKQIFVNEHITREEQCCLLNGAGVDLEKYVYYPYPTDNEEARFLFIGRVMKEKGIDELFEAMKMLRKEVANCTLDIVGRYEEDYKEQIEKYEKEGWVRYHGYQKDVRPFIANCHCFVLPSWHEGMANTNLECAAMGRPVITSNIHGCMESVEDHRTGYLCKYKDADALYKVMKKFTNLTYEERKNMGLAGRQRMKEIFDKKKVVEFTINKLNCWS